jgi:hypothetical protein
MNAHNYKIKESKVLLTALWSALLLAALTTACKKNFLEVKPDKALLVPVTLSDFRALLDNNTIFNKTPGLTGIADGDTYATDASWKGWIQDSERNSYVWGPEIFVQNSTMTDWLLPYQQVFYANVVLDGLKNLSPDTDPGEYRAVKGTALFYRAWAFYQLIQEFTPPYAAATAAKDLGIPLRLVADVTQRTQRSSVEESFGRVKADLVEARGLLPAETGYKTRPSLPAVYAMLARVNLVMDDYMQAGLYADSCLLLRPGLIDYNTLNPAAARPFPVALPNNNDEVIFYAASVSYSFGSGGNQALTDTPLYRSYLPGDLRKALFFTPLAGEHGKFKGHYTGTSAAFSGLATDEMYLLRAECQARGGDAQSAMTDLNHLLERRWQRGGFAPLQASSPETALAIVLAERRKELTGRVIRWSDLRRLNTDARFRVTLQRSILGTNYTLEPGSIRYVYPIPPDEVRLGGLTPNPR